MVKVLCRCRFGMAEHRLKWRDDYWGHHGETAIKFGGVGMNMKLTELYPSLLLWCGYMVLDGLCIFCLLAVHGISALAFSQSDNKVVIGFSASCFWSAKGSTNTGQKCMFFRLMNYGEWCSLTICSNLMPTIIGQVIRFDYIVFVSLKKRKRLPIIYACHLGHGYIVSEMQGSEVSLQVALKWILQRGVAVATQSTSFFGCSNRPVDYK